MAPVTKGQMPGSADWPNRATIVTPDGNVHFFGRARLNTDGSVTVEEWGEHGPYSATHPASQVRSVNLSYEIESDRWLWLYQQVYGRDAREGDA
jgi:hypothetical protein